MIQKIYAKKGVLGLYSGLAGTILGVASTNFAYFYWYGLIRNTYTSKRELRARARGEPAPGDLSTAVELALGALAGALAQLFTIPISVVTTRQQTSTQPESLVQTARSVVAQDGVSGLWRGLKASLVLVINPSITYGSYERLKNLLFHGKSHLKPGENFLLGALSKSMATIATQPLIISKVMQQSGGGGKNKDDKKFNSFVDALVYLAKNEGLAGLFKGIGPQITKGILVQGLLFMFKDQVELLIVLLIRLVRKRRVIALPA